jgi:uncharacterized protein Yka (UPF0111/DUF47 family)
MDELINELASAANLLRTVKVDGEYWLQMSAVYNSIVKAAQKLKESEVVKDESGNNSPEA